MTYEVGLVQLADPGYEMQSLGDATQLLCGLLAVSRLGAVEDEGCPRRGWVVEGHGGVVVVGVWRGVTVIEGCRSRDFILGADDLEITRVVTF